MLTIYAYDPKQHDLTVLDAFQKRILVVAVNPTEDELSFLQNKLKLERGHLIDALDPYEVPRLEVERDALYVFTRVLVHANSFDTTIPLLCVVTESAVVLITAQPVHILKDISQLLTRPFSTELSTAFMDIFAKINVQYSHALHAIRYRVNQITRTVEEIQNKDIIKLVHFENTLNDLLSIFTQNQSIMETLLRKKDAAFIGQQERLEDCLLETGQLVNRSRSTLKSVTNVRDAYSTILTNNLNQVVKFFTSISVILMIPTVVASFFGMNVPVPFATHEYAFIGILFLTLIISLLFLVILYRKKLL